MSNQKKVSFLQGWKLNLRSWKIWWEISPRRFIAVFLKALFSALSPYVTIFLSARLIGELAGGRDPRRLAGWALLTLVLEAILTLANSLFKRWVQYELTCGYQPYQHLYMNKMQGLDFADMDRQEIYDLYSQIAQSDAWSRWGLRKSPLFFESMITGLLQILGGIGLSFSLFTTPVPASHPLSFLNHPLFALLLILLMLAIAVLAPVCGNRGTRYWNQYGEMARAGNRSFSFYGFMCTERERAVDLRMYDQQDQVCNRYMNELNTFGPRSLIARYARGPMGLWISLSSALSVLLTGIVYLYVCLKAWGGAFGVDAVTQYVGAITQLFLGISALLKALGEMRVNGGYLLNCFKLLDLPNRMYQGSLTTEKRSDRQYEIEFRDVSFRYPGSENWALRHVNMRFRVGSRLAVVGQNGSGKTTFIKLLCRLYDPTEGTILLNGIDIRKYRYDDYIQIFSVVFQDFRLVSRPLGENVACGMSYDAKQVGRCLNDAGFREDLNRMPLELSTYLYKDWDQGGVDVSGGEAQKISIARALYKDAPFIILDEPTAALDPIAEAEIYSKFNEIVGDKTAIYISHRLSSCRFCDEIAVFSDGAVVQQGSHDRLAADPEGLYYALWHAQAQYYTEE